MKCEHLIGLLHKSEDSYLITQKDLHEHIEDETDFYNWVKSEGVHTFDGRSEPYTMDDYCDMRKSTDITRFSHCPICGAEIDWKGMKNEVQEM